MYHKFYKYHNIYISNFRQFGGYVTKIEDWISEAQQLIKAINDPSKYVTKTYFTAGYNSPFEIFHRHNEIWFIAKQNVCAERSKYLFFFYKQSEYFKIIQENTEKQKVISLKN